MTIWLKTICAFANDIDNWGGGYLILGVEEENGCPKFPIKGIPIDKVDDILKDLLNKCKMIQPEYLPVVEVVDFQETNSNLGSRRRFKTI